MFTPLGNNVLIKRIQPKNKTESGLHLPEAAVRKPLEAIVEAVGPGEQLEGGTRAPMHVRVGDRVIFGKFSGHEITLDETEYIVCQESDILGILGV